MKQRKEEAGVKSMVLIDYVPPPEAHTVENIEKTLRPLLIGDELVTQ